MNGRQGLSHLVVDRPSALGRILFRALQILIGRLPERARRRIARAFERAFANFMFLPDVEAEYAFWSVVATVHDQQPPATPRLVELALEAAQRARTVDMSLLAARLGQARVWTERWPGEHYRLLAALTEIVEPAVAVEVGTFTGMSALAMQPRLREAARFVTYDVVDWRRFPDTVLHEADFADGLQQRLGDLSDPGFFAKESELLRSARLIFVDGPKDGRFEPRFFDLLLPLLRGSGALLVIDDIRLLNMVRLWRRLPIPKLDLTSFGHWSGTGLAQIQ